MLVKVDRASMAHSLEVRAPFLDHGIVEWAAGLPLDLKLHDGQGKRVLKLAMRPYLPAEIIDRPKRGFSPPLARWLRRELAPRLFDVVQGRTLAQSGLFDMARLMRLAERHVSGRADHATALWAVLTFDAFLRHKAGPLRAAEAPARAQVGA
jgi:asparagine synthase (glutamine-hydrolysing)